MYKKSPIPGIIILYIVILVISSMAVGSNSSPIYPEYGSAYIVPISNFPFSLDPIQVSSPVENKIESQIYEGLVRYDNSTQIEPLLAESWENPSSDSSNNWIFHLRKNVLFHDGTHFDATAIQYSFERLVRPDNQSPKAWILDYLTGAKEYATGQSPHISGLQIIDPYTVQFNLKSPNPDFLYYLSTLPTSMVPPSTTSFKITKPIGTGPFIFDTVEKNQRIHLVKNPNYWGGRPYLDSLVFTVFQQEETQQLEFELNHLQETRISEADYRRISSDEIWKNYIIKSKSPTFVYLGCNLTKNPVNNILFRQGISQGIDRGSLLTIMLNNHGKIPSNIFTESEFTTSSLVFTIESSKQALSSFSKQSVTLLIPSGSDVIRNIGQRIQLNARMAGLTLQIKELPYPKFYQTIQSGDFELYYGTYNSQLTHTDWVSRELFVEKNRGVIGNTSSFYNSEFITLLHKYSVETSIPNRSIITNRMNEILWQFLPIIPLYTHESLTLYQPNICGLDPSTARDYDFCTLWINKK